MSTGALHSWQQLRLVNPTGAAPLSFAELPSTVRKEHLPVPLLRRDCHMWCDFQGGLKSFKMG